ncbi:MAG: hypothetical protein HYR50_16290 [Candidatus Rokubacteria bacterium]|nr:hypothetical protein [Candidatus Rokubacteria bacterium]
MIAAYVESLKLRIGSFVNLFLLLLFLGVLLEVGLRRQLGSRSAFPPGRVQTRDTLFTVGERPTRPCPLP